MEIGPVAASAEGQWNLVASLSCPDCGSFLDAPRIDPLTGNLARKCLSCREWHPVKMSRPERAGARSDNRP